MMHQANYNYFWQQKSNYLAPLQNKCGGSPYSVQTGIEQRKHQFLLSMFQQLHLCL